MTKTLKILLFILFISVVLCIYINYNNLNLAQKLRVKQMQYKGADYTVNYCETFENRHKKGRASMVLLLHSGRERGDDNLKQLEYPAVKPLLNYVRKHKIKVYILMPQYGEPYGLNYPEYINEKIYELAQHKIKEFNINPDKVYITGSSRGGIAAGEIIQNHPGVFSKYLNASSPVPKDINTEKFKNTEIFFVFGSEEKSKIRALLKLQNLKYKILEGRNHYTAMDEGFTDDVWEWMFKQDKT